MEARIEILEPKKLIGIHKEMSLADNKTAELWRAFMPRRAEVTNRLTAEYISMQTYHAKEIFAPHALFEKWAAVEVSSFTEIPPNMETYLLQGGQYAVFTHRGPASAATRTMQYIFGEWLPNSPYKLDDREHFEILPETYNPTDPDATEEIWIPIKD